MNQLDQIEKIYDLWNGTNEHASICLRYIHSIIHNTRTDEIDEFITKNLPFNE